ncbi:MAG: hypothetical protein K8T89_01695 [Planctomycetes bacterium]|nr:hypothetical protein [Planctomycetota bacterium]
MRSFVIAALGAGVPFAIMMGLVFTLQGDFDSFAKAIAAGLMFGISLAAFKSWQATRFTSVNPCVEGETLLKQGAANHAKTMESVGGWLYLTNRRFLFRPHRYNIQKQEVSIPLREIVDAQVCLTAFVIPNGLLVVTSRGKERFVVEGRRSWVEEIRKAKLGTAEQVKEIKPS